MEHLDQGVEDRAGQWETHRVQVLVAEHRHRRPEVRDVGQRERVAGHAELLGVRKLANAVQLVRQVQVAVRRAEEVLDHRVEVQHGDHGRAVRSRLLVGEVIGADAVRGRKAEERVEDRVTRLVGEHVEIQAKG